MDAEGQPVIGFSFTSISTEDFLRIALDTDDLDTEITSEGSSAQYIDINYIGVPRNLLSVLDAEFLIPD